MLPDSRDARIADLILIAPRIAYGMIIGVRPSAVHDRHPDSVLLLGRECSAGCGKLSEQRFARHGHRACHIQPLSTEHIPWEPFPEPLLQPVEAGWGYRRGRSDGRLRISEI